MKKSLMPYVARLISSDTLHTIKRTVHRVTAKLRNQSIQLAVFIKVDDPYSYLLLQVFSQLTSRFAVTCRFYVINDIDEAMYPKLDMWRQYAAKDAAQLAALYGLSFPQAVKPIPASNTQHLACHLAALATQPNFPGQALPHLYHYWHRASVESLPSERPDTTQTLANNLRYLGKSGHYQGAMIKFQGEWYWGLDRLDHLETRLIAMGLARHGNEQVYFNKTYARFCQTAPVTAVSEQTMPAITLFWSARSPYSYIALERAVQLAQHYQRRLDIKPVLTMMMRGMNVPPTKKMYIFLDTKREAKKLGLPYGFVADPLGAAVERCYALLDYAESQHKLIPFLLSFARAVNTEGIRAETDAGLKRIVTRCGLNWATATTHLARPNWQSRVDQNLKDMFAMGCWGVPSMRYQDHVFWGQDRFGLLEQAILQDEPGSATN